jgi:hypothetical protein
VFCAFSFLCSRSPQLEGLKLKADDELIYVFTVDADTTTDDSKHPMVSILITDAFIGEEVNPERKHHQAYTLMRERKPGVVYERKYRKVEDRIQPHNCQKSSVSIRPST